MYFKSRSSRQRVLARPILGAVLAVGVGFSIVSRDSRAQGADGRPAVSGPTSGPTSELTVEVPAAEGPEAPMQMGLRQARRVRGVGVGVVIRDQNAQVGDPIYTARAGELLFVSARASDGFHVVDQFAADGRTILRAGFVAAADLAPAVANGATSMRGRLDLNAGETATLYRHPGKTDRDCAANESGGECLAQLPKNTTIEIRGSRLISYADLNGAMRSGNFYFVSIKPDSTSDSASGPASGRVLQGWINATVVDVALPGEGASQQGAISPDQSIPGGPNTNPTLEEARRLQAATARHASDQIADQLAPFMGSCLLTKPTVTPNLRSSAGTPFAQVVKPHWRNFRGLSDGPTCPNGSAITHPQMEAIDGLARTLYAEMEGCWEIGSHYMVAVAATIVNREDHIQVNPRMRDIFARMPASLSQHPISDVISSPFQYSPWNFTVQSRNVAVANPALKTLLCPPAQQGKLFFTGWTPTVRDSTVWQGAVRIATQAVLFKNDLKARTNIVDEYFTSGVSSQPGYQRVTNAVADGMPINNPACVQIWHPPNGIH